MLMPQKITTEIIPNVAAVTGTIAVVVPVIGMTAVEAPKMIVVEMGWGGGEHRQVFGPRQHPNLSPVWYPWAPSPPWAANISMPWNQSAHQAWPRSPPQQQWTTSPPLPLVNWTTKRKNSGPPRPSTQLPAAAFHSSWPMSENVDQPTSLPEAFQTMNLQDPMTSWWFMETGTTNHLSDGF